MMHPQQDIKKFYEGIAKKDLVEATLTSKDYLTQTIEICKENDRMAMATGPFKKIKSRVKINKTEIKGLLTVAVETTDSSGAVHKNKRAEAFETFGKELTADFTGKKKKQMRLQPASLMQKESKAWLDLIRLKGPVRIEAERFLVSFVSDEMQKIAAKLMAITAECTKRDALAAQDLDEEDESDDDDPKANDDGKPDDEEEEESEDEAEAGSRKAEFDKLKMELAAKLAQAQVDKDKNEITAEGAAVV